MHKAFLKLFFLNLLIIWFCFLPFVFFGFSIAKFAPGLIFAVVCALVFSLFIYKQYINPLNQLKRITEKISVGEFSQKLALDPNEGLTDVASLIQKMSAELQNKIAEIDEDKNEFKAIISSMVEGVIIIGRDERILLLSDPVLDMLDLRSKDTIGKPYWEVIRHEEVNHLLREAIRQKHSINKELTIITPVESFFNLQISTVFSKGGILSGVVAVFHDITELKKMAGLRSEFVANVSHELKTPLTTIKGFVETLQDGALNDPEKAKKFLEIIQKHTERLENLVNDLLSISALESKEMEPSLEKVSLGLFIDFVVNLCKDRVEKSKIRIEIKIASEVNMVFMDRPKMEQALLNLLDNAIKFTPSGGIIQITAFKEDDFVRIDVKDSGIGISSEHLPRLFERFYRVDRGRSREMGGTGLGLAIVKHILQIHGGKITVKSQPNQGSTFSIFLPNIPV